jgi:hypothetical protein
MMRATGCGDARQPQKTTERRIPIQIRLMEGGEWVERIKREAQA